MELLARADDVADRLRARVGGRPGAARGPRLPHRRLRAARRRVGVRAAQRRTRSCAQELAETLYHVLWELCHVFFDHRGLLEGRDARRPCTTPGASSFLYPFLAETQTRPRGGGGGRARVGADEGGARWARCASRRSGRPRRSLPRGRAALRERARARRQGARAGQRRLGHGRDGRGGRPSLAAARAGRRTRRIDLTEDPAIITAIANDVGVEADLPAPGDRLRRARATPCSSLSTSGNSANVIARAGRGAPARPADRGVRGLRRRPGGRRAPGRPRGGHPLGAHPAHPGGAGERLARAARAARARRR